MIAALATITSTWPKYSIVRLTKGSSALSFGHGQLCQRSKWLWRRPVNISISDIDRKQPRMRVGKGTVQELSKYNHLCKPFLQSAESGLELSCDIPRVIHCSYQVLCSGLWVMTHDSPRPTMPCSLLKYQVSFTAASRTDLLSEMWVVGVNGTSSSICTEPRSLHPFTMPRALASSREDRDLACSDHITTFVTYDFFAPTEKNRTAALD